MKKIVLLFIPLFFSLAATSTVFAQQARSAFAAVPAPGQPVSPVTPTPAPVTPQAPGVARPPTPAASATPGAKPEEQLRIVADPSTNSLIIYGTAQEFQNIKNILKDLDITPRQVLMDVLVAEVTLTNTENFGIAYEIFRGNNSIFGQTFNSAGAFVPGIVPSAPTPVTDASGNIISTLLTGFPTGLSGIVGRASAIRAFINVLATQNRVRALASPSVLATDNRPARIQVGSEIPILTGQTSTFTGTATPLTSNAIQYRNTGVILTIIPQVNSQGLVNLQVKQEVSAVGQPNFGSTGSPSFSTRDAETTAVVQDGETLAIGGIIQEQKSRNRTGVPYLMDLPVFGRFFSSTQDETDRTELVILITPHVIRSKDEARSVTEEFKNRLSDVRNELERLERDRRSSNGMQAPQLGPMRPDIPPPTPTPSSPTPVPGASIPAVPAPVPAPARAPGVSMAPTNSAPVPAERVASATPTATGNAGVKRPPELEIKIEANSTARETSPPAQEAQPVEPYAPETDAVGVLLNSIETKASESPDTAKPVAPTVRPTQVWVVQVASFATEKEAQTLANKLKGKGYDANVATAEVGARTWYRVEVGRLASRNDARELQKNLQATEKIQQSIIASR